MNQNTTSKYKAKKMKKASLILALAVILTACGNSEKKAAIAIDGKNVSELMAKKSELVQKVADFKSEIERLEAAIERLDTTQSSIRAAYVEIDTIMPHTFKHYIEIQGSISSEDNILVSPERAGVITKVFVDEGDRVRAGQVLAAMDASALESQLRQVKASYQLAHTTYERRKKLWDQNIGSEIQLLQAQSQMNGLKSQMDAIQAQINTNRIVSPIAGEVDAVNVKVGEMANPGMSGIRVVNMDELKAQATIAGQYAGSVQKGDKVKIFIPSLNMTIEERISFVSLAIDQQTQSIMVEAELKADYPGLKPNMIAKLKINNYTNDSAIVVSSNVLLRDPNNIDDYYVMAVDQKDEKFVAQRHKVEIGKQYSGETEILNGLPKHPVIITFGFEGVADGQALKFNTETK